MTFHPPRLLSLPMPSCVRWLVFALLLLAPGVLGAQAPAGSENGDEALRLRPGDAVRLEVRDEPQLAGDFAVDAEGHSLFPLVGLMPVAARPFDEVRRDLLAAFARELSDAAARVRLTPVLRIAVLGEVIQPGLVPVDPTFSLADVIASAGGLTPSADRRSIALVRAGRSVLTTSMDELPLVRTPILSGDQIVVGRRSWVQENLPVLIGGGVSVLATLLTALILR